MKKMKRFGILVVIGVLLVGATGLCTVSAATEAVHFSKLIPFLPDAPSGWEGEEPDGMMFTVEEGSWSMASKSYTKSGAEDITAEVGIMDSAFYQVGWWAAWQGFYAWESTEGYAKTTEVKGLLAWESYTKDGNDYGLYVGINDRFMVFISTNSDRDTLYAFANSIDYSGIAAYEESPTPTVPPIPTPTPIPYYYPTPTPIPYYYPTPTPMQSPTPTPTSLPIATPIPTPTSTPVTTKAPIGTPQLTISQTTLREEPEVGEDVLITVTISNTGDGIAKNINLREHIPSSVSINFVDGANSAGNLITWSGDLYVGQTYSIIHSFRILEEKNRAVPVKVTYEDESGKKYETSATIYISAKAEEIPAPTLIPGFEVVFAIAGLLAVAYLLRRRN